MASLADLFNPTFLMFLGILVLVAALLVVYFESKMREKVSKQVDIKDLTRFVKSPLKHFSNS